MFADLNSTLLSLSQSAFRSPVITEIGAPVAQWVKRWPTDLAVVSSSPA